VAKGSNKKIANGLVAASAAAVMAVYAAGYERTKAAASKLDAQFAQHRPVPADVRPVGETSSRLLPDSDTAESPRAPIQPGLQARIVQKQTPDPSPVEVASSPIAPSAVIPPAEPVAPVPQQKTDAPMVASVAAPAPVTPAVAPPSVPAPATGTTAPPAADKPKYKDGTYTGWGSCRHGDLQAQITIEGGKITVARISQCLTRYSCDVIGRLPPEVLQRQSAEVDWVTGATQSADAFSYAVSDALSKAR
jgi:uncharacterized protein with FMN-binding domain